jgi:hypothetical protein
MRQTALFSLVLFIAAGLATGCSPSSGAGADDVKPVAPPAGLVGKWRLERTDGKNTRTVVYDFQKGGRVEMDVRLDTPDLKATDLVKGAVVKAEKDRITLVDLSRTSAEGVEDVLPVERRRSRTLQFEIKDDELRWTEVGADGKPVPDTKAVLKRVKK